MEHPLHLKNRHIVFFEKIREVALIQQLNLVEGRVLSSVRTGARVPETVTAILVVKIPLLPLGSKFVSVFPPPSIFKSPHPQK